jgi:hypothetical protein
MAAVDGPCVNHAQLNPDSAIGHARMQWRPKNARKFLHTKMQFKGARTISTAAQFGVLAEPAEFQRVFLGVN